MRVFDDGQPPGDRGSAFLARVERRYYADATVPVPIVYGRTRIPGILVEQTFAPWGSTLTQKVVFLLLGEGPIDSVVAYDLDDVRHVDQVTGGKKLVGIFVRLGGVGVDDSETIAEYNADPTTQVRAQNVDYRTKTGNANSESAYVIFLAKDDAEVEFDPALTFDIKALQVQAYDAAGAPSGAVAWSENPIWQAVDFLTSDKHGLGGTSDDVDLVAAAESAGVCVAISSTEASTTISTGKAVASTQCLVVSAAGFVKGRALLVNGVANSVAEVVSPTEITLGTAIVQTVGWTVVQRPLRFESHAALVREEDAVDHLETILDACRGFISYDAGKLQLRIERATVGEFLVDGGLEVWSSATNLTSWTETTTGGSVNREAVVIDAGTYALRFDRTGAGQLEAYQAVTGLEPGAWYRGTARVRGSGAFSDRFELLIYNATRGKYWRPQTGDWGSHVSTDYRDVTTSYATEELTFRTDAAFAVGDSYLVALEDRGTSGTSSVYVDAVTLRGPYAGDFRELSPIFAMGIVEDSFEWELADDDREINQVRAQFINLSADQGRDEVTADDFDDQIRRGVRSKRWEIPAVVDRDQAYRLAKWRLDRARVLGPSASFTVGPAGLAIQPGDVVLVSHSVPAWSFQECRVRDKEIHGLGDELDLCVGLRVEGYSAAIYPDSGVASLDVIARGTPTFAVTIDTSVAGQAQISFAWTGDGYAVQRYLVYASTSSGFEPDATTKIGTTTSSRFIYAVPKARWNVVVYFKVRAQTDIGTYDAPEVSATVLSVDSTFTDPTQGEDSSPFNHVWDGDFSEQPTGWDTQPSTGETVNSASSQATESGYTAFSNPGNGYASDDARAVGVYEWDFDTLTLTKSGVRYSGFGVASPVDGFVRVEGFKSGDGSCTVSYSPDGGTNWYSAGVTIPDGAADAVVDGTTLTGINLANLRVRILRSGTGAGLNYKYGEVAVDHVAFVTPTLVTPYSLVESGAAKLVSDGTDYAEVRRRWPGQTPVGTGTILPANSFIQGEMWLKHDGAALTANVQLVLVDELTSTEWVLLTVASGDVTANWKAFRSKVDIGATALSGQLAVVVRSKSTNAVRVDKVADQFGSLINAWAPSPGEMQAGIVGDFTNGRATGYTKGSWTTGPTNYKTSTVA